MSKTSEKYKTSYYLSKKNDRNKIMAQVVKNFEQVYDPEMPSISVIHLGLIYDIEILEDNTLVKITHTLTSAFCPMADEINQNIKNAGMVEGVKECIAKCTFQPPFSMDMVTEEPIMGM